MAARASGAGGTAEPGEPAQADEAESGDLAKKVQNPVADLISVPFNFRPDDAQTIGRWQLRAQLAFSFPTKKPKPKPAGEENAAATATPASGAISVRN